MLIVAVAAPVAPTQDATVEHLTWLVGYWTNNGDGARMMELWLPPEGGVMLGLHRDVFESGQLLFEFLRIEQRDSMVVYVAAPSNQPAGEFTLVESGPVRAVFENPDHDFPQRIIYELTDDVTLVARVEGEVNGTPKSSTWTWNRARFPSPK